MEGKGEERRERVRNGGRGWGMEGESEEWRERVRNGGRG